MGDKCLDGKGSNLMKGITSFLRSTSPISRGRRTCKSSPFDGDCLPELRDFVTGNWLGTVIEGKTGMFQ